VNEGVNIPPRGQISPLEDKFTCTGEVIPWGPGVKLRMALSAIRVARWFVFKSEIPNLGKFWRALDLNMCIYFMAIWNILWVLGIFYDHLVNFVFIWYWYIFSGFGIVY
jgi:hypothetical protein